MVRLLQRSLTCHYCNKSSPNTQAGIPKRWLCPHCDADNYVDERGRITDPPYEVTSSPPPQYAQPGRQRSMSPDLPSAPDSMFCKTCLRNQAMLTQQLAEYLPDEDDPEYAIREANFESYRAELELRYPQVCKNCVGGAREHMARVHYGARSEHFARQLLKSKEARMKFNPTLAKWQLRILDLTRFLYLTSIMLLIVWYALGARMWPFDADFEGKDVREVGLLPCPKQVFSWSEGVLPSCFIHPTLLYFVEWAIWVQILSFWYTRKLETKALGSPAPLKGFYPQSFLRLVTAGINYAAFFHLKEGPIVTELGAFKATNAFLILFNLGSAWYTWRLVKLVRKLVPWMGSIEPYLPQVPERVPSPPTVTRGRPRPTGLDNMASSFDEAMFPIESVTPSTRSANDVLYPPSPSLTEASESDERGHAVDKHVRNLYGATDEMDWTPEPKRHFQRVDVVAPVYPRRDQPEPSPVRQPHSIFAAPETNPFRRAVPPRPRHAAHVASDPWKQPLFKQTQPKQQQNFFQRMMQSDAPATQDTDVHVPRRVKRDEDLFQPPQFKYDTYTAPKDTGLESAFSSSFKM